jgi:hypothetical protein
MFEYFLLLLLLSSSFIVLWSESMQWAISILLYLLRLALCPKEWSILEKVPWAAGKNVYCAVAGWNTLQTFVYIRSMVSFKCTISLLNFCPDDLCFGNRGVLKSHTTTVLGSTCDFKYMICLIKLSAYIS